MVSADAGMSVPQGAHDGAGSDSRNNQAVEGNPRVYAPLRDSALSDQPGPIMRGPQSRAHEDAAPTP